MVGNLETDLRVVDNLERSENHLFGPKKKIRSINKLEWKIDYRVIPEHRNHVFDPASVFLSTHWWSQHLACQRSFYKPFRNCQPSQRVSTVHLPLQPRGPPPLTVAKNPTRQKSKKKKPERETRASLFLKWSFRRIRNYFWIWLGEPPQC